jgi:uncharacterized membrane protein YhaH (DUF805 family)
MAIDTNKTELTFWTRYKAGWRRAFDFKGRSTRLDLVAFYFFNMLALFLLVMIIAISKGNAETVIAIFQVTSIIPCLSLSIRRVRDTGRSPWQVLIPVYSIYVLFLPTGEKPPTDPEDKNHTKLVHAGLIGGAIAGVVVSIIAVPAAYMIGHRKGIYEGRTSADPFLKLSEKPSKEPFFDPEDVIKVIKKPFDPDEYLKKHQSDKDLFSPPTKEELERVRR